MTKVYYGSDFHLEKQENPLTEYSDPNGILVVAGDVKEKGRAIGIIDEIADNWKHVVFVPGNHDWWGLALHETNKHVSSKPNVHVLLNETKTIEGIDFVGGTSWVPIRLMDSYDWKTGLNDSKYIRGPKYRRLEYWMLTQEHEQAMMVFRTPRSKNPRVLVTHHPVTTWSLDPRFIDDPLTKFYASDDAEILIGYDHHIHGHVHCPFEYTQNGCAVHCNPRGYRSENIDWHLKHFEI